MVELSRFLADDLFLNGCDSGLLSLLSLKFYSLLFFHTLLVLFDVANLGFCRALLVSPSCVQSFLLQLRDFCILLCFFFGIFLIVCGALKLGLLLCQLVDFGLDLSEDPFETGSLPVDDCIKNLVPHD